MSEQAIDPSVLARLESLGGKKLTGGLIQMYMERTPEKMEAIHSGINNADFEKIENVTHSLISSAGNLGGMLTSKLAAELEAAAISKNMAEITKLIPDFMNAEKLLRNYLKEEIGKP